MKKFLIVLLVACAASSFSYAQLKTPSPSPTQIIKQDFALSNIELSYSRPGKKGRNIFGDLVPFGKVWRTGANQATTITFGDEVTIGGVKVPAGKYGLLAIPEKDKWTLIITKQLDVTNPAAYKKESDVARVEARTTSTNMVTETFTMQFANIRPSGVDLQIMWDNVSVSLPITADVDTKVMTQIEGAMNGEKPPYFAAASYYFESGKDLKKAAEWAQKAVDENPKAFYMVHLLARIQAKSGNKAAAIATAKKSIELSKEAKNDDYVKLNEKLLADLK
jgi:hypothetical protein